MDEKKIHSIIDEAMAARDRSVSIYISPDGGVSVSVFPWPVMRHISRKLASSFS